jgi:Holliday junction DNA helicase RuvA
MIAWLRGRVIALDGASAVVDVNGVGYRVHVPSSLLGSLTTGVEVELHTYFHVRDSEMTLFGAADQESMRLFEMLLGVNGVGPRLALAVLGAMETTAVLASIESEDADALTRVPGVGRKTALRMILDLRGKLPQIAGGSPGSTGDEALLVLTGLGYTQAEALRALDGVGSDAGLEGRVRAALRRLSGDDG